MAIDLFKRLAADEKLHPQYLQTRDDPRSGPARAMLAEVAATMADPDGNFVQQFQTHGFDSRTFEIYLQALFTEAGHAIDRSHDRPDFLIARDGLTVAVEAVTANPPPRPDYQPYEQFPAEAPRNAREAELFLKHEVAIRLGSPLYTKLQKKYWELPHVEGKPLVIAIENFHGGGLGLSSSSLSNYLFGVDHHHRFDKAGNLIVEADPVQQHKGSKTIPSNFFGQEGAEHISGILFSNVGTVPKFGRIGQQGAHRSDAVRMIRIGERWDPSPNATVSEPFSYEVGDPAAPYEPWRDGTVFIRNPRARLPIPPRWIGASAEEELTPEGTVAPTILDPFHVYSSRTIVVNADGDRAVVNAFIDQQLKLMEQAQKLVE